MMALRKRILEDEPSEIELLLPWHAAGTLSARDARRVEEELARNPELARQHAAIREEYAETIALNESLGAPSARAMQKLFAAIEAEPAARRAGRNLSGRIAGFFSSLSPRTLAWSTGAAAVVVLLQAGVIGAVLMNQSATYETASLSMNEPLTRALGEQAPPRALVRFAPDARMADITALLETYHASIINGSGGGMFRLQFGDQAVTKEEEAALMRKLQSEKIVALAVASP